MKKSMKKRVLLVAAACTLTIGAATVGGAALRANVNNTPQAVAIEKTVETAVLKQGSKGSEVKEMQRRLKLWDIITARWTVCSARRRKKP